jgi:hypothetical protein
MATLRQKFRVRWDNGDMIEVQTSARDLVAAGDFGDNPAMASFALIHAALERSGYEIKPLDEWIDQLDELEEGPTKVEAPELGPTKPVLSGGAPSPWPASPARTGAAGSTTKRTTARSKRPKTS